MPSIRSLFAGIPPSTPSRSPPRWVGQGAVVNRALELLGIDHVFCSPIPTGSGVVHCAHGVMPVPTPATAELLTGVPLAACEETGELTTPTAAAVLTTLAESFGPLPAMTIGSIGYGAGTRE